jgi:hypothetical protein
LKKHLRQEHLNEPVGQKLLRGGLLGGTSLHRAAAYSQHPKCPSCQFEKRRRRPSPPEVIKSIPSKERNLKSNNMFPGKTASGDHSQSSAKGQHNNLFEKSAEDNMCSVSMHHATGNIHLEQQVSWTAETTATKYHYERHTISYKSDREVYCEAAFIKEMFRIKNKYSNYSGVRAQHQNGVFER